MIANRKKEEAAEGRKEDAKGLGATMLEAFKMQFSFFALKGGSTATIRTAGKSRQMRAEASERPIAEDAESFSSAGSGGEDGKSDGCRRQAGC